MRQDGKGGEACQDGDDGRVEEQGTWGRGGYTLCSLGGAVGFMKLGMSAKCPV